MSKTMSADKGPRFDAVFGINEVERVDKGLELDVAFGAHCGRVDIIPTRAEVKSVLVYSSCQAPRISFHRLQGPDVQ